MSANSSRVRMKSSSSSSTNKALISAPGYIAGLPGSGQFDRIEPILTEHFHDTNQGVELKGFGDKRIGPQLVNRSDIRIRFGSRQNNHRDPPQFRVVLNLAQSVPAILERHVQIQEDQPHAGPLRCLGLVPATEQVIEQFLP